MELPLCLVQGCVLFLLTQPASLRCPGPQVLSLAHCFLSNRLCSSFSVTSTRWHASRAQALLWQAGGALAYVPAAAAVAAAAKRSEMLLWQGCAPREGSRLQIQHDYTASVQAAAAAV